MKQLEKRLTALVHLVAKRVVDYFLGPQLARSMTDELGEWYVDDEKISAPITLRIDDHHDRHYPLKLHNRTHDDVTILVVSPTPRDLTLRQSVGLDVIALVPSCVEQVMPMITEAIDQIAGAKFVVLAYVSRLPSDAKPFRDDLIGRELAHEYVWKNMVAACKKLQHTRKFAVLVIEHETTVGKKNSAWLRRLFLEHDTTN